MQSNLEREFLTRWLQLAPDYPQPVNEFIFATDRKWRFDFCWPDLHCAVEMEGIGGGKSRHTSFTGYTGDIEKYNRATLEGYRILRFTGAMIKNDPFTCIEQVKRLLESWNE